MVDVWLPGAHRNPGANAGYNAGRNRMELAVAHYTVGADSRGVAERGFFHFLVHRDASREGGCTQYAEVDAITWHAAAWNDDGPGIEYERLTTGGYNDEGLANAQPLTDNQLEWGGRIVAFLAEWGIPPVLYDGPRYGTAGWRGWVNHHDIDADRFDGLTRAEWERVTGGGPPEPPKLPEGDAMYVVSDPRRKDDKYLCGVEGKRHIKTTEEYNFVIGPKPFGGGATNVPNITQAWFDSLPRVGD